MLNLTEFVSRQCRGTLEERRRRGLMRLHDLLAETDFHGRYWMIMGLLPGCLRDGGPIVNNDGRTAKWTLRHQAIKHEFFQFERHGDRLRWYHHRRKPPLELVTEVPAHDR